VAVVIGSARIDINGPRRANDTQRSPYGEKPSPDRSTARRPIVRTVADKVDDLLRAGRNPSRSNTCAVASPAWPEPKSSILRLEPREQKCATGVRARILSQPPVVGRQAGPVPRTGGLKATQTDLPACVPANPHLSASALVRRAAPLSIRPGSWPTWDSVVRESWADARTDRGTS